MVRRRPASPGPTRLRSVRTAGFTLTEGIHAGGSRLTWHYHEGPTLCFVLPGRLHGDVGRRAPHLFARDPQGDARGRAALRRLRSGRAPGGCWWRRIPSVPRLSGPTRRCWTRGSPSTVASRPPWPGEPGVPPGRRCRPPGGRGPGSRRWTPHERAAGLPVRRAALRAARGPGGVSSTSGWCSTARPPTSSPPAATSTRDRLTTLAPDVDVDAVCSALTAIEAVCRGDQSAGAAGRAAMGTRLRLRQGPPQHRRAARPGARRDDRRPRRPARPPARPAGPLTGAWGV